MIKRINSFEDDFSITPIYQYVLLALIVMLAIALRFFKLGDWSFWGDEMIFVRRSMSIFDKFSVQLSISRIGANVALNLFGTSEWSARLVPAMVGILSVPILYFPIRKIFGPFVALLASLLLAISQWHIYWSQNARFYTSLLLLFSLALFFFYFGLEEDRPWYLILSLLLLALAFSERLVAGFFMPIAIGYVVLLKVLPFKEPAGLRPRNLLIFFGPAVAGGVYLAVTYLPTVAPWQASNWISSFGFVNNNPFWIFGGVVFYLGVPLVCMSVLGAIYLLWRRNRAALLLSLAAVVPLLAIMVISLVQYAANRYVFVSLIAIIVLASAAVIELLRQMPQGGKILAVGILLVLFLAPMADNALYYRFQNGNRDNWKDAFALIQARKEAGDRVVTTHRVLADYYLQERTYPMKNLDIASTAEISQTVWFVIDLTAPDKAPDATRWIEQNAQPIANLDVTVSARTFPMRIYMHDPSQ